MITNMGVAATIRYKIVILKKTVLENIDLNQVKKKEVNQ